MLVKVHDARLNKILAGQGLPTQDYAEIEVNLTAAIFSVKEEAAANACVSGISRCSSLKSLHPTLAPSALGSKWRSVPRSQQCT